MAETNPAGRERNAPSLERWRSVTANAASQVQTSAGGADLLHLSGHESSVEGHGPLEDERDQAAVSSEDRGERSEELRLEDRGGEASDAAPDVELHQTVPERLHEREGVRETTDVEGVGHVEAEPSLRDHVEEALERGDVLPPGLAGVVVLQEETRPKDAPEGEVESDLGVEDRVQTEDVETGDELTLRKEAVLRRSVHAETLEPGEETRELGLEERLEERELGLVEDGELHHRETEALQEESARSRVRA